jgi:hypothetical protein
VNGQKRFKNPLPNAANIVNDIGLEGHAGAKQVLFAKRDHML